MGILNVTPDSFSGDGILAKGDGVEVSLEQARRFVEAGAVMLDVGGDLTRPGSQPLDAEEERGARDPGCQGAGEEFPRYSDFN